MSNRKGKIRFLAVVLALALCMGGCAREEKKTPTPENEVPVTRHVLPTTAPTVSPTEEAFSPTETPKATEPISETEITEAPQITLGMPEDMPVFTPTVIPDVRPTSVSEPTGALIPTESPAPEETPTPVLEEVEEGYYDKNIIPDKYNTGCYDTSVLEKINSACVADGVEYNMGDNGDTVVIDLFYRNRTMEDEVIIRNVDFSDKSFAVRHASKITEPKVIRFENCKFSFVKVDWEQDFVKYEFDRCTFTNFYGSNASFDRCFFGGDCYDGMNPFQNVMVTNCYFGGFPQWNDDGRHLDAVQIFGKEGCIAKNILFQNCRMEIPIIKSDKGVRINACLMVQLEYSDAQNIVFEDCIINGGGYSIYAWDKRKGWRLDEVVFRNIAIGSAHLYHDVYPYKGENVNFENLYETNRLYVSSVWKDANGRICLSVTNDTEENRTLIVVTEEKKQKIVIESMRTAEAIGAKEAEELPIDLMIETETTDSDWVICYDGEETPENQIRFVNWGKDTVYREVR